MSFTAEDLTKLVTRAVKPVAQFRSGPPVEDSEDLRRIMAIPRRYCDVKDPTAAILWTKFLRRERIEPCDCVARWGFCITDLKPAQGWGLENAMDARALYAALGVGDGKTGLDILLALAIPGITRALLLIPPSLKAQFLTRDYPQWSAHFKTPILAGGPVPAQWQAGRPTLHVVTYSELSNPKNSDLIKRINPELIIADEAQNIGDPNSARTGRFLRAFGEKPNTRFAALSGSFTSGSIRQFAHFLALSFRDNCPVPLHPPTIDRWALALDAADKRNPYPCEPGALLMLCGPEEARIENAQDKARSAFSRRLYDTLGCIATSDPELPVGLEILERVPPKTPETVKDAIASTLSESRRPDGEELQTPLEVSAVTRRLSAGFYYRWRFPSVPEGHCPAHDRTVSSCEPCMAQRKIVIDRWKEARKKWRAEVRYRCKDKTEHLDSPMLLENAAERWHLGYKFNNHGKEILTFPPHHRNGPRLVWESEHWPLWNQLRHTVEHAREAVWISDWLARDAAQWAIENKGIIWYEHDAFATMVVKVGKEMGIEIPMYGGGKQSSIDILLEKGDRTIIASVKAHGEGKNLQHAFHRNLIANVFGHPKKWEQTVGRTHRSGQLKDVVVDVYRHTPDYREAIRTAQARARFIEQTNRNKQRLSIATIGWEETAVGHWTEADELALDTEDSEE